MLQVLLNQIAAFGFKHFFFGILEVVDCLFFFFLEKGPAADATDALQP
jgi:hypothetical protein